MKLLFLLALSVATGSSYCQNDSLKVLKNEIGINFRPYLSDLLPSQRNVGVTYKRRLEKMYLNLAVDYLGRNSRNTTPTLEMMLIEGDKVYSKYVEGGYFLLTERVGLEHRRKNKYGAFWTLGLDLLFSQEQRGEYHTLGYSQIDSVDNSGMYYNDYHLTELSSEEIYRKKDSKISFGLGPNAGLLLPIGKHWSFQLKTGLSLLVSRRTIIEDDNLAKTNSNSEFYQIDFDEQTIQSLSLFFRF